jgi:CheY-like chemotaxis protein
VIKLLIVEDDINKRRQLHGFVQERFPGLSVADTESLIGGIRKLRSWEPDLVLLDMTLPNYDPEEGSFGVSMQAFGGEEFLRQCQRFRLTPAVVVVTQFETFGDPGESKGREELANELAERFPDTFRGMVYYHASLSAWTDELEAALRKAMRSLVRE